MQTTNLEEDKNVVMNIDSFSSLSECFKVFDIAHSLTVTPQAVFYSTYATIKEFKEENVIYLELRSTPRAINGQMTKQEYVESIIEAFRKCEVDFPSILVKLLISVNRKEGYTIAKENVELAIEYFKKYPKYIVGLDLSGDPMTGDPFLKLLEKARMAGLKVSAHCAEISNETETMDILEFKPDRLGHCTCIHPDLQGSARLFDALLDLKIPVELCLTSNVLCKTVPSYAFHQFKYLYEAGHPVCLCTDDKGVFRTSLSREYEIAGTTFALSRKELVNLSMSSVQYAFATSEEKYFLSFKIEIFEHNVRDTIN